MVDELDRKLMMELKKSGRQGYVALAKMLGVVEGTVRKRVKDLVALATVSCHRLPPLCLLAQRGQAFQLWL